MSALDICWATKIYNGTSEANIGAANGNLAISISGVGNVAVFTPTGLDITGTISANGNITGGNIITSAAISAASVSASANVTGGNLITAGAISAASVSASANVTGGNLITAGAISAASVSASANVTAGNIVTSGSSGNIFGANVISAVTFTATGNVIGGNIVTAAAVSAASVSASGNITGGNVNTNTIVGTGTTIKSTGDLNLSATGNVTVNGYINNVTTPVQDLDAANKGYVDSVAQGLDAKASVHTATTAALPAYTYNNGTSGVGATLTGTATGTLTIAGDTILFGQRVLVKNETGAFVNNTTMSAAFNGIYVCTTEGAIGVAFVLTRAVDFDLPAEMYSAFTFVETGTGVADTGWVCTNNLATPITVGTTEITFAQFSGAGQYTANTAAGLLLTGSVFSAKVDGNANPTIGFDGAGNLYVPAGAAFTTPNIGAATGSSVSVTGNITSGNLNAAGLSLSSNVVSALNVTGNIAGGNITTPGLISATGNITGGNITTSGASGNISGANVISGTTFTATGNITGGNLNAAGLSLSSNVVSALNSTSAITTTANITGGNLNAVGLSLSGNVVSAFNVTGNITGGNVNGVNGVYSGGVQVLTINDTVDGGTY
jgi:hypothetical protein